MTQDPFLKRSTNWDMIMVLQMQPKMRNTTTISRTSKMSMTTTNLPIVTVMTRTMMTRSMMTETMMMMRMMMMKTDVAVQTEAAAMATSSGTTREGLLPEAAEAVPVAVAEALPGAGAAEEEVQAPAEAGLVAAHHAEALPR
jgi:hypothetical protein